MKREIIADLAFHNKKLSDALEIRKPVEFNISANRSILVNSFSRSNSRTFIEINNKKTMHRSLNTIPSKSTMSQNMSEILEIPSEIIFVAGLGVISVLILLTVAITCLMIKRKNAQTRQYDRFFQSHYLFSSNRTLNSILTESSQSENNGIKLINFEKRSNSLKMQQLDKSEPIKESVNELTETKPTNAKNKLPKNPKSKKALFTFKYFDKKVISLEDTHL
jgi:hypothetical protein